MSCLPAVLEYMRADPGVMPPILWCQPAASEVDVGVLGIAAEPCQQYSVTFSLGSLVYY